MNEEFEIEKASLQNAEHVYSVSEIADAFLPSPIDMVIKPLNFISRQCYEKKKQKVIELIQSDKNLITKDMLNDIDCFQHLISAFESIKKLTDNEKIQFYLYLVSNAHKENLSNMDFDAYIVDLDSISYLDLYFLYTLSEYEERNKEVKEYNEIMVYWEKFKKHFLAKTKMDSNLFDDYTRKIRRSGYFKLLDIGIWHDNDQNIAGKTTQLYKNFSRIISPPKHQSFASELENI